MKRILSGVVVAGLLTGSAVAGPQAGAVSSERLLACASDEFPERVERMIPRFYYNCGLEYYKYKDYTEAVKLFQLAAEQRHGDAQRALGLMYAMGKGVSKDYVLALMWLNLARIFDDRVMDDDMVINPNPEGEAHSARDLLASQMTPDQVTEAQRLAQEWVAINMDPPPLDFFEKFYPRIP